MFVYPVGFMSSTPVVSIIQNIQNFSITISSGSTSNTATISAVNASNAFVVYSGCESTDLSNPLSTSICYLDLTNTTTVTATRALGVTGNVTIYGSVIEFTSAAIVSMQKGTITLGSGITSNTATISAVNASNAFVVYGGMTTTATDALSRADKVFTAINLTNTTTVTANRSSGANGIVNVVSYTVVEMAAGLLTSNQKISSTFTSSSTTDNITISAVNTANSLVLYNGETTALTSYGSDSLFMAYLTSSTNLRYERYGTSTTTRTVKATVIEFNYQYISTKTAAQPSLGTTSNADTTVAAFNSNKTWLNFCNNSYNSLSGNAPEVFIGCFPTSTTNIRLHRNSAVPIFAAKGAFELLEFI